MELAKKDNKLYMEKLKSVGLVSNISKGIITNKKDWVLICDTFRARGYENFVTIGNFKKSSETRFIEVKKQKPTSYNDCYNSYYYIDDVSLVEISDPSECKCNESIKEDTIKVKEIFNVSSIKKDSTIILQNINFETDKSELLSNSFNELDKLYNLLKSNSSVKIEVSGHTDNAGTENHNKQLSEARAKAVVDYLIEKGIKKERLSYKGYGSSKPIADNNTDEGKAKNRRVEFKIVSK